ncbi:uncharacterized protein Bfra_011483 [Botrytis fragariae]|uniref:Phytocyanin domain-containing protein n=1 Tax=Botrytis fragariae TaxID=1964551 RepID=A0A8H6AYD1_9HELO|nr:uncharacterized protein Bfra_011483 [Botrytis fragariae]KAF5875720.1 hypothetical protein Bfra_011483 [Botrytis fragariae]
MKFSSISTVSSLLTLASAQLYTETIPVVCSGAPPSTVTQTVTITERASGPYCPTTTAGYLITSNYVTTADGTVTSVNYDGESKSTIWVYPTGTGNEKHCTVATYENDIVIDVNIVDITIIIIDGFHVTNTVTVTDNITYTPTPPIQTTTTSPHSTETDNSYGEIHHVTVGDKGLNVYSPNQINAKVGDIIRFKFLARNHTVTQSNFNTPCNFNGGFDTSFNQFNPTNATNITRDFIVNTNKPIWFHCAQANPKSHCQAGMVLGINPAGKFDAFLEKAKNSGNSTVIPSGTGYVTGVPAPTDTYITKTGPWITGVPAPSGYSSKTSGEATYTPLYKYPSIKRRSF